jgi:hypothetical protein
MTDNVVVFPKQKLNTPPQSLDEMITNIESFRKDHIENSIAQILPVVFVRMAEEGFDLTLEDDYIKDSAMIIEAVRSAMYRIMGFDHKLHPVTDAAFVIDGDNLLKSEVFEYIKQDEDEEELS